MQIFYWLFRPAQTRKHFYGNNQYLRLFPECFFICTSMHQMVRCKFCVLVARPLRIFSKPFLASWAQFCFHNVCYLVWWPLQQFCLIWGTSVYAQFKACTHDLFILLEIVSSLHACSEADCLHSHRLLAPTISLSTLRMQVSAITFSRLRRPICEGGYNYSCNVFPSDTISQMERKIWCKDFHLLLPT